MTKVIIEISGGNVSTVYSDNAAVEVYVVDYDLNDGSDHPHNAKLNGEDVRLWEETPEYEPRLARQIADSWKLA